MRSERLRTWLPRLAGAAAGGGVAALLFLAPVVGLGALGIVAVVLAALRRGRLLPWLRAFASGIGAVGTKELRGRMRGRRAFTVLTLYLALLAGFAWAVTEIQKRGVEQAQVVFPGGGMEQVLGVGQVGQSSLVGQTLFTSLLVLLTLLIVFLAPAFTAGAISQEREKQTFELLVATPLPALAIVLGKLLTALVYLFLLILASIPLMSLVFTFGGISPDDVVRAYAVLVATAIGLGALGLFFSALVRRTQVATVLTYLVTLGLTLGSLFVFVFWGAMVNYQPGASRSDRNIIDSLGRRPPEALVWLNPTAAVADVICGTGGTGDLPYYACGVTTVLTNQPFFGAVQTRDGTEVAPPQPGGALLDDSAVAVEVRRAVDPTGGGPILVLPADVRAEPVQPQVNPFGVPRDKLWPRIVLSEIGLAVVLPLLSVLLVSPARLSRPRLPGPTFRRRAAAPEVTR